MANRIDRSLGPGKTEEIGARGVAVKLPRSRHRQSLVRVVFAQRRAMLQDAIVLA
jgi:hypothetical protein